MNPDRNKGGMTIDAIMQVGLVCSALIPIVALAIVALLALTLFPALLAQATTFIIILVVVAAVAAGGVLITNMMVRTKVLGRVQSLIEVCRDYAAGDRNVRASVDGDDDFAVLALSLNSLLENQGNNANNTLGGSGDAAALQAQIEKLLQEVSAVGDGDLRVQAEVTPDTLGVLADSFNYMIEELAKVVGRVQSTAVQVTNATRRILDRSQEQTQASEAQVQQISQTTESVEALANFIQNVARNAQMSADVAQQALKNAAAGQQAVGQTLEGMKLIRENVQETAKKIKRLGERSNEIGEIVRIIADIADQTNLLALNAAIQSAMAGEHGRGFAVVADEIRLLAERSTESTKRITNLVKSIQGDTYEAVVAMEDSTQEVVKGSQLADNVQNALNSIYADVERQAQMIESIARSANEQASVSEAVAVAMARISEITRQTDASTQEAAVSVSYLAELAEQLRASVSTFRLPERVTNDISGSFPNMTSVSELSDENNGQFGSAPFISSPDGGDWQQGFSGNFPPLPEPEDNESLLALGSRSGQFGFDSQPEFGNQAGFGGPQSFSGLPGMPNQFSPSNSGFSSQPFGQQDFADLNGFDGQQQGFGNFQGSMSGIGNQNQFAFPNPGSTPNAFSNSGLLPTAQPGQAGNPASRQRQQGGPQQNPDQFSFNQDQKPF
ncbi:methyl-accepting chemotaxis protein [Thermosporothrix hazakensis]|uniref:Methyl-accepting chemotaxis protein n=2 Tax=Thermosporothrix hazakensis TaxID=644383 RepID=A0A326UGB6_THEHA|nr:methyl-accepting chemotaxis protein [Thermosporothrix hazakensis]GCE49320.1 hypothetical protein KTH_41890 [Thermosporothrix hazakensis]